MRLGLTRLVDDASLVVEKLSASLTAMSPQATLDRGYAVVQSADGRVVSNASQVEVGESMLVTLRQGRLVGEVVQVEPGAGELGT